jgi:hypothetical protein
MRYFAVFIFAIALTLLSSCKSHKIMAEAPDNTQAAQQVPLTPSTINVPVSIDVRQLANMLNRQLQGTIYTDNNIEDDNLKMTVKRIGNIALQADNNRIIFSIPLHIWAEGRAKWDPCSFCPSVSKTQDIAFDVTVRTESQVSLTENWQVKTNTVATYAWGDSKPSLAIGPVSIPISGAIDLALKPYMKDLDVLIDRQLAPYLDLRPYIKSAWASAQEPVLLDRDMSLWLKIDPLEIRMSPVKLQNNYISMIMGLKSYVSIISGNKPVFTVNNNLPKLIIDNSIQNNLQIGLQGYVSYENATRIAREEIAGKTFSFDDNKYKVRINDLALSPQGDKIQVKVDLTSFNKHGKSIGGIIFAEGTPYYDETTQSIRVMNLDYNVKTKNLLLKSAAWLVNKTFMGQIEQKLDFPIGDYLKNAAKQAQQTLTKGTRINDMALLKGSLTKIDIQKNIYITPDAIVALSNLSGNITIQVDKL